LSRYQKITLLPSSSLLMEEKYALLEQYRPSVLRNSALMLFYRVAGFLLGLLLVVMGMAMLLNSTVGFSIMPVIVGDDEVIKHEQFAQLHFFIAIAFIIMGILCYIISRLALKQIRRNLYIINLEEIIEAEVNKGINK